MSGTNAAGEFLLLIESRAHGTQNLSGARRSQGRRVRLHRMLLQGQTPTLDNRLQDPHAVRVAGGISLGGCQPNRVQATLSGKARQRTNELPHAFVEAPVHKLISM
jgi:hypothetical protein